MNLGLALTIICGMAVIALLIMTYASLIVAGNADNMMEARMREMREAEGRGNGNGRRRLGNPRRGLKPKVLLCL